MDGRTELDPLQGEIDEAKRLLEEAHVEVQAAQAKVAEAACRVGGAKNEMAKLNSLMEANLASAARRKPDRGNARWEESKELRKCGQRGMLS